jgi:hypothetical protein
LYVAVTDPSLLLFAFYYETSLLRVIDPLLKKKVRILSIPCGKGKCSFTKKRGQRSKGALSNGLDPRNML